MSNKTKNFTRVLEKSMHLAILHLFIFCVISKNVQKFPFATNSFENDKTHIGIRGIVIIVR